jgi:hypothetical protein
MVAVVLRVVIPRERQSLIRHYLLPTSVSPAHANVTFASVRSWRSFGADVVGHLRSVKSR